MTTVNGFTYTVVPAPRWNYRDDRALFGVGHRFLGDYYWSCPKHGDAFGNIPRGRAICEPDPLCTTCQKAVKRVARVHKYFQTELGL